MSKAKSKAKPAPKKAAAKKAAPAKAAARPQAKPAKAQPTAKSAAPAKAAPPPPKAASVAPKAAPAPAPVAPPKPVNAAALPAGTAALRKSRIPPRETIRSPVGADELKAKIGALATQTAQIRALKRGLSKSFYEIGTILVDIRDRRLYEAKGYGSFEAFVEREIELGKQLSLRLVRIVGTFLREAALAIGLDRASAGIAAIDGETESAQPRPPAVGAPPPAPTSPGMARSPIPFHKQ
ncbi:MAG: hypothetical protein U0234_03750 [Sandaracinus sp.]